MKGGSQLLGLRLRTSTIYKDGNRRMKADLVGLLGRIMSP